MPSRPGARAGLDVYLGEPRSATPVVVAARAASTRRRDHHIGASTAQAQRAVADGVVSIIEAYVRGEILNCVNLAPTRLGTHTLHVATSIVWACWRTSSTSFGAVT